MRLTKTSAAGETVASTCCRKVRGCFVPFTSWTSKCCSATCRNMDWQLVKNSTVVVHQHMHAIDNITAGSGIACPSECSACNSSSLEHQRHADCTCTSHLAHPPRAAPPSIGQCRTATHYQILVMSRSLRDT